MQFLVIAYAVIALLLLLRYRSSRAFLVLLTPISSSIMVLGLLSSFGIAISLFHVFALFLVLGLGMDYGIFLRETGVDNQASLLAIFLSAVTTCLGFGLLAISDTPMVSAFGLVMLMGGLLNLLLAPFIMDLASSKAVTQ